MEPPGPGPRYVPVAEIEVDAVLPTRAGFRLDGRGADGAAYQIELHLDLPVDQRTQQVLAEIFSQSELKVSRRAGDAPLAVLRRERARQRK
jgi:hypothetical protein